MLFRAESEGVHADTRIRGTCVVLVRLDNVEVRTFTLREAVLAVKLELSGDDRVLAPTVHVEGSLGKNECSCIRKTRCVNGTTISRSEWIFNAGSSKPSSVSTSDATSTAPAIWKRPWDVMKP